MDRTRRVVRDLRSINESRVISVRFRRPSINEDGTSFISKPKAQLYFSATRHQHFFIAFRHVPPLPAVAMK